MDRTRLLIWGPVPRRRLWKRSLLSQYRLVQRNQRIMRLPSDTSSEQAMRFKSLMVRRLLIVVPEHSMKNYCYKWYELEEIVTVHNESMSVHRTTARRLHRDGSDCMFSDLNLVRPLQWTDLRCSEQTIPLQLAGWSASQIPTPYKCSPAVAALAPSSSMTHSQFA
jgi:hypothetical protein